jgi:asparagine synthase (glutamine-hydrolysing)
MCGIVGAFRLRGEQPVDRGLAEALACIAHRGPDDDGTYILGSVALGHRRLSILDTSSAGHQPFTDENGRHTIIYNGEVFNFPELRKRLIAEGHRFRSNTDTEVILRLYTLKGPAFLHDLNGFFALAIHDAMDDSLFIARDRFGVKPLYWTEFGDRFLFASEMRAFEKFGVTLPIDEVSRQIYFTHHYIPAPHTIHKGIQKLLPGHSITVDRKSIEVQRWYHHEEAAAQARNIADPVQYVRQLLDDAVRIRLLSDVPIGTFLSGGLDSSIISALAKQHKPDLHTFSIGFTEKYFDETEYAEEVARHIGSQHHTFTLSEDELAQHYQEFLSIIDEPFADSSALPSYLLNKHTRKFVTVALSGDGADEIFGGYRKHQAELRLQQPGMKEQLAKVGGPLWDLLPASRNSRFADRVRQLRRFSRAATLTPRERYLMLASFEDTSVIDDLLGNAKDPGEFNHRRAQMAAAVRSNDLNDLLWADLHTVLPNDMLLKVDLTSMANSLEVRTPFLDHRLVSYAFSLPAQVKFNMGNGKALLRQAFSDLLPPRVVQREKKGFEVPLRSLFLGPLRSFTHGSIMDPSVSQAGLDPAAVQSIWKRLQSGSPGNSQATVHAMLVYLTWWRRQNDRASMG